MVLGMAYWSMYGGFKKQSHPSIDVCCRFEEVIFNTGGSGSRYLEMYLWLMRWYLSKTVYGDGRKVILRLKVVEKERVEFPGVSVQCFECFPCACGIGMFVFNFVFECRVGVFQESE